MRIAPEVESTDHSNGNPANGAVPRPPEIRRFHPGFHWDQVTVLPYKQDELAPFRAVTRQVLFSDAALGCELRYFEIDVGGHSTLERHEHAHGVMISRGQGQVLLGDRVHDVAMGDLVRIDAWIWHQFRANRGLALGFLCMVNAQRDRPQLPDATDLAGLLRHAEVEAFLKGTR